MKIRTENKDRVLMENHFISGDHKINVDGYYGLTNFEISTDNDSLWLCSKEEFNELFELMQEMKKEIDRLNRL